MKLNFKVFKKGSPLLWIGGAIVLFVLFYMLANKGASSESSDSSGNIYTTTSGISDAAIAASTQLSIAQLQANIAATQSATELAAIKEQTAGDIALATIGANVALAETTAARDVSFASLQADQNIQLQGLNTQKAIAELQTEYAIESAEIAAEVNLATVATQRAMFEKQLDTNKEMLNIQSRNLISQSLISQVGSLKKKDRDEALAAMAGVNYRGQTPVAGTGLLEQTG